MCHKADAKQQESTVSALNCVTINYEFQMRRELSLCGFRQQQHSGRE